LRRPVDEQLNVSALYLIQKELKSEDLAHIRNFKTAKGAWDHLAKLYVGNASIQNSKYESLKCVYDAFAMEEDDSIEELYRRLTALGVAMRDHGDKEVNDDWVKQVLASHHAL